MSMKNFIWWHHTCKFLCWFLEVCGEGPRRAKLPSPVYPGGKDPIFCHQIEPSDSIRSHTYDKWIQMKMACGCMRQAMKCMYHHSSCIRRLVGFHTHSGISGLMAWCSQVMVLDVAHWLCVWQPFQRHEKHTNGKTTRQIPPNFNTKRSTITAVRH